MNVQLTEHEEYSLDDEFQHDEEDDEVWATAICIKCLLWQLILPGFDALSCYTDAGARY